MIEIIERGWAGHSFYRSCLCRFNRNTLLIDREKDVFVIVSTRGNVWTESLIEIRPGVHYETKVFVAKQIGNYIDELITMDLPYTQTLCVTDENWSNVDNLANDMHQRVLAEVADNINNGVISMQIKELEKS